MLYLQLATSFVIEDWQNVWEHTLPLAHYPITAYYWFVFAHPIIPWWSSFRFLRRILHSICAVYCGIAQLLLLLNFWLSHDPVSSSTKTSRHTVPLPSILRIYVTDNHRSLNYPRLLVWFDSFHTGFYSALIEFSQYIRYAYSWKKKCERQGLIIPYEMVLALAQPNVRILMSLV